MGGKRKPDKLKLSRITIVIPKWQVDRLRDIKGYNKIIEKFLDEYFSGQWKDSEKMENND